MHYIAVNNSPYYGGGVEQVVSNIAKSYPKKDNLKILCNDRSLGSKFYFEGVECINLAVGNNWLLDKLLLFSQLRFSKKIYIYAQDNLNDNDTLNIHGVEYCYYFGCKKNVIKPKVIVTVHGSIFHQITYYIVRGLPYKKIFTKLFFWFWRWYYFLIEKKAIGNKNCKLIFICQAVKRIYQSQYQIKQESTVIYNGITIKRNNLSEVAIVPRRDRQYHAIIVGSNYYLKGLDIALSAINQVNSRRNVYITLEVVGFQDFEKIYKRKYINHKYIIYSGKVNPTDMTSYYKKADFLLLPSRYESFPLTVLEALSCGIPIVVSSACNLQELPHYTNLGIVVESSNQWADAIEKITKAEVYCMFKKEVDRIDLSDYSWANIALKYQTVFLSK